MSKNRPHDRDGVSPQALAAVAGNLREEVAELQALRRSLTPSLRAVVLAARVHGSSHQAATLHAAAGQCLGALGAAIATTSALAAQADANAARAPRIDQ